ncbi:PriA [Desulfamplus magnetovallimortis]|uniref:Replication restart protein PriA n=1 Tax=Desulfamplus magnetovallimortis TaxID=1246637 RepID=A0A1W1HGS5_9BACT|nr:primosomal protein N' [Desulfamplus magnetovallimortis]SLM31582.1 PriA [Desulfamplus magnetovallimortis]
MNRENQIQPTIQTATNDQGRYVDVAVALPIHHTFTYEIPPHLMHRIKIGMRVLVPFGRRRITGYVVSIKQNFNSTYKTRLILDLLDDAPLFPASMVDFFTWISRYYIHPPGEVIKTALPLGLDSHDITVITPTSKGIAALEEENLTPAESSILSLLIKKGSIPAKEITNKKTKNKNHKIEPTNQKTEIAKHKTKTSAENRVTGSHALIKKMEENGLVTLTSSLKKDRTRLKTETFISVETLPEKDEMSSLSRKRQEMLSIIKEKGEISLGSLRKIFPTATKLVKYMVEAGYVKTTEKQVFRDPFGDTVDPDIPPELTEEQAAAVQQVKDNLDSGFNRYLLSGVTGSGKTEVYLRLVTEAINRNMGAIVLVPEISLISQTERRFRARFGNRIAVLHSALSSGELLDQWHSIASGELSIVIGARSAIFAPVKNPGIIIVDEEHDSSYKQENGLRYNARDLAVVRAQQHNISVILGSATPSIQSSFNTYQGKFREIKLTKRVNRHELPEITLIDLKKYKDYRGREKLVTPELTKEIAACLARGEQALIFLNRRGFATFPVCEACGEAIKCRFCDITMTLHRDKDAFQCHLCGFSSSASMSCPHCKSPKIKPLGFGTEKIENLLKGMFPHARVARLDQDTGSRKGATVQILKKVKNHTVDIIVGTQMLAKGHDFPDITLVGIICADLSLNFPDFRAGERTFQLLAQVAGRAGRGTKKGKVIMQTYNPDHFSIEASRKQDFLQFYNSEIPFRQALSYPPFSRIIQLKISGCDMEKVKKHAIAMGEMCHYFLNQLRQEYKDNNRGENLPELVDILGPIEAGIPKIAMRYRWQILLKSASAQILNNLVRCMIQDQKKFSTRDVSVGIDVDPYFMM